MNEGLESLNAREAGRRLAALGGHPRSQTDAEAALLARPIGLADTSVWVDHFRTGDPAFAAIAEDSLLIMHPAILGELARAETCATGRKPSGGFGKLPQAPLAGNDEVMALVERRRLWGLGIGWIDAH